MYPSLAEKVALITGSGAGIGAAIARRFGKEKAKVIVNDLRAEAAERVAEEIAGAGGIAVAITGDMTKEEEVNVLFAKIKERFKRIDILVNNVGLFSNGALVGSSLAEHARCMDINVTSAFLCANQAAGMMRAAGSGCIVNISSGAAKIPTTGANAYGAAKLAIIGMTRTLAAELGPNIRVNSVLPGCIDTEMDRRFVAKLCAETGQSVEEFKKARDEAIPLRRLGQPEDIANVVAFVTSDQACYMTGSAINVTGGLVMD